MAIKSFPFVMQWAKTVAPGVKHIAFKKEDGTGLKYKPGQFITFYLDKEDKPIRRSYSIASIVEQDKNQIDQDIEIAISYVEGGIASELLFNLKEGESLNCAGPFGRLILREPEDDPKRYVLIATGTGVTPYRCMLPEIARRLEANPDLEVVVVSGVQRRENALYPEDFVEFAKRHPRFSYRQHYSREALGDNKAGYEYEGRVLTSFDRLNLNPEEDLIYLCGNPNMIDDAFELSKEKGFTHQQVRREKYIS